MTAKQYLSQLKECEQRILEQKRTIEKLREIAFSISVNTSGDKVMSSGSNDKIADAIAKIVDRETEISENVKAYLLKQEEMIEMINGIAIPRFRIVLYFRYVLGYTFERISFEADYSYRQTLRIHGNALNHFEDKYKDRIK